MIFRSWPSPRRHAPRRGSGEGWTGRSACWPRANSNLSRGAAHAGHAATGTSLYHYKARAYSPALGRFLQTDPAGYDDGLNWYAYVGNDPLNRSDPTGLEQRGTRFFVDVFGVRVVDVPVRVAADIYVQTVVNPGRPLIVSAASAVANEQAKQKGQGPPVPDKPVGVDPATGNKGRITSGPLAPGSGGTGDPDRDFDNLTGGISNPPPPGST